MKQTSKWVEGTLVCLFAVWISTCEIMAQIPVASQSPASPLLFADATKNSGIDFVHTNGGTGKNYIVETVSAGLAIFDFDGDGWMDIYFLNGAFPIKTKQETASSERPSNRLYRNFGNWQFVDVTEQSGVGDTGHGLGVSVGDFDNDGDPDLYVNNFGPNIFYRNQGDGTFSIVRDAPGANESRVGAGVSFLDIEGDGDLDLFVGNYVKFSYDVEIDRKRFGVRGAQGPKDFPMDSDQLFRNNGDGNFADISVESGIDSLIGPTMGVVSFDYNRDGDTDLFVCNDSEANFLWDNDGHGHFTEIAKQAGVAFDHAGARQASMGVDCGDFNNDGWLDLAVTNFQDEVPNLYRNSNGDFFEDFGIAMGMGVAARSVKWGIVLSDFDHDSFLDLFIGCGHLIDVPDRLDTSIKFATRNILLKNLAGKKYQDVSRNAGSALLLERTARAIGSEDLDSDGDLDNVILNLNSSPTLLRNDSPKADNHWLQIRLVGTLSNRDAVGTQVTVVTNLGSFVQEVHRGRGYQSHYGNCLHFGLGKASAVESVEVHWHGGSKELFRNISLDQKSTLIQGTEANRK